VVRIKELAAMNAQLVETTIKTYLTEIRSRLDKAAGIGRAADACAGAGFHEKGPEVALDMEQLLYEAPFGPVSGPDCKLPNRKGQVSGIESNFHGHCRIVPRHLIFAEL
jgi:hypothetical protein